MAINGNDLFQRIVAGAVYISITGLCTLISWQTTAIIISVTAGICAYEFMGMAQKAGFRPYKSVGTVTSALIPLAMSLNIHGLHVVSIGLTIAFLAGIVCLVRFVLNEEGSVVDVALTIFCYLYVGLCLASFVLLREQAVTGLEGGILCLLVLLSVWGNDAFAYLGGSAFGKHKFSPRISPKKTWEGVICGMLGSIVFWLLIPFFIPDCGFGYAWAGFTGLLCGIVGIIGDLTESRMKRCFGVKDSGNIMPGHGGLLDRSDSLMFVSVVACFMVVVCPYAFEFFGVVI